MSEKTHALFWWLFFTSFNWKFHALFHTLIFSITTCMFFCLQAVGKLWVCICFCDDFFEACIKKKHIRKHACRIYNHLYPAAPTLDRDCPSALFFFLCQNVQLKALMVIIDWHCQPRISCCFCLVVVAAKHLNYDHCFLVGLLTFFFLMQLFK